MDNNDVVRVVIFREGDTFIAQGLEVDICAQGASPEAANERFGITLNAEAAEAEEQGIDLFDMIKPAPSVFHTLYDTENGDVTRKTRELPKAA